MYCRNCGAEVNDNAVVCVKCGCILLPANDVKAKVIIQERSPKDWITTLLLCFFVGALGVHRFYVGKVGTGVVQLLTLGGCGIWTLIDFILIIVGKFTDGDGKPILNREN